jgi:hypothetical protein
MYIPDLSPCDYFSLEHGGHLLAVGWLGRDGDYARGSVDRRFYEKLKLLLVDPFPTLQFCGLHECDICQFNGALAGKNAFIPGNGRIYVCPELIIHYINCHNYLPPKEFIDAVLDCPEMRSVNYLKKLLANNGRFLADACKMNARE